MISFEFWTRVTVVQPYFLSTRSIGPVKDYFEIFSALREIQLAQQLFVKFNLLLFFLIS